eukprot:maker-scaffold_6-snap-gene-17.29-mRNA-1 protein AED:0.03 eAED:0.03 QI:224/1/1/1/1/1/5/277/399
MTYFRGKRGLIPQSSSWPTPASSDEESDFDDDEPQPVLQPPVPISPSRPKFGGKRFVGKGAAINFQTINPNLHSDSSDSESESELDIPEEPQHIPSIPEKIAAQKAAEEDKRKQAAAGDVQETSGSLSKSIQEPDEEGNRNGSTFSSPSAPETTVEALTKQDSVIELVDDDDSGLVPVSSLSPSISSKRVGGKVAPQLMQPVESDSNSSDEELLSPRPPSPKKAVSPKSRGKKRPKGNSTIDKLKKKLKSSPTTKRTRGKKRTGVSPASSPVKKMKMLESSPKENVVKEVTKESPKKEERKVQTIEQKMTGIASTVAKLPKLNGWAVQKGKSNQDILEKLVAYLRKIGAYILDNSTSAQERSGMWEYASKICKYEKGGMKLYALYQQMEIELLDNGQSG